MLNYLDILIQNASIYKTVFVLSKNILFTCAGLKENMERLSNRKSNRQACVHPSSVLCLFTYEDETAADWLARVSQY